MAILEKMPEMQLQKNIILIGMPGAGKSTAGVILAKTLQRGFIDTDIVMQERTGRLLQEILDTGGPATFKDLEEETILSLHPQNSVIATGGSVIYSNRSMQHLKEGGIIVYLQISFEDMERRLRNIRMRGIVLSGGETLREMYDERIPLYERYADITIDCSGRDFEMVVGMIVSGLRARADLQLPKRDRFSENDNGYVLR
jgi:shikimate kinase